MARNWKKMSKEEEDKKRQETIDKAIETMKKLVMCSAMSMTI